MTPPSAQPDVRLRRRLSDKDKERRLVRRSSSKRKDKENGDGQDDQDQADSAGHVEANNGGHVELTSDLSSSRGSLKRTSSVENTGSGHGNNHALLCRTRSEDAASSSNEVCEAGLTRSLPRI